MDAGRRIERQQPTAAKRKRRRLVLRGIAAGCLLAFLPLQLLEPDIAWLSFAGLFLIATPTLIVLAVISRSFTGIAVVVAFMTLGLAALFTDTYSLRERVRWAVFASHYKAEVLASPQQPQSRLQHAVWDAWGFVGMDTTVYLVFDPDDSLSVTSRMKSPVKPTGFRCAVDSVHQMEPHWYSIRDYTGQEWNSCG